MNGWAGFWLAAGIAIATFGWQPRVDCWLGRMPACAYIDSLSYYAPEEPAKTAIP